MKKEISLSLFFPAYNEENQIEETIKKAEEAVKKITQNYELIIVNDGSQDKTGEIADTLASVNIRVRVVHHRVNQGYGASVWSGVQACRFDYIFLADSDLQFDLAELEKLIAFVPEYKVVIGYRAPRRDPFMRIVNAKGWNFLNRMIFGLKVKDIDCAFKLFERELVATLPIKSRGAMISAEILIRLQRQNISFKEIPVTHFPNRKASTTGAKPQVILRAFRELFSLAQGELGGNSFFEALKFGAVGIMNTAIDLGTYFLLTRGSILFLNEPVSAKAVSFFIGSVFSFIVNRRFTFKKNNPAEFSEIAKFYTSVLSGLFINTLSTYLLITKFHLFDLVAVIFATIITFAWNFTLSKFWVFKKSQNYAETNTSITKPATEEVEIIN